VIFFMTVTSQVVELERLDEYPGKKAEVLD